MQPGLPPQLRSQGALSQKARNGVLRWYDANARDLPWRTLPRRGVAKDGESLTRPDPYRVWLSEIMLQQTTVAFVAERFPRFLAKWPDVAALAAADLDAVLTEWAGLGYYARARNLHACARAVAGMGGFPEDREALRVLPGIGDYTAAAVAAIAFEAPVLPVDANIERVIARVEGIATPLPKGKTAIKAAARGWGEGERPGDFAQALMDLGAGLCRPKAPLCMLCPLRAECRGFASREPEAFPVKAPKKARPERHGAAFWLTRGDDVLLRRNPPRGLLGGMMLPPATLWREESWSADEARQHAPAAADWQAAPGQVRHVFTHFALTLDILCAAAPPDFQPGADEIWADTRRLEDYALPGLGRKIAAMAMNGI